MSTVRRVQKSRSVVPSGHMGPAKIHVTRTPRAHHCSLFPAQPPGVESSRQARQASGSAVYMYHPLVAVQPLSVVSRVGFTVNVLNWPQSSHNLNDPWCTEGSRAGHSGTHAGDGTNWLLGGSALSYLQTGGASTSKVQWRRPLRCSSDHGFSPITASHRGDPAAECGQP